MCVDELEDWRKANAMPDLREEIRVAPERIAELLIEFVKASCAANNKSVPIRLKYEPYYEGADDFAGFLMQKLSASPSPKGPKGEK